MQRRTFIINTATASAGILTCSSVGANILEYKDAIIGHGSHQYKIDLNWGALNPNYYPVNDCHEMVQDSKGRILLLTNHTKNNIIVYDRSGNLLEAWGTDYPGAHGLTLNVENGEDYLYIADNNRHEVIKTTIDGKVVQVFSYPKESGKYIGKEQYIPTETTIAENGDVYIADGYGEQYIMRYNAKGKLLQTFGGRGDEDHLFNNAHGICIDTRGGKLPELLITARQQNKLKRFTMDGEFIASIDLPGAYICRPVIKGENVYLATIWSGDGSDGTGFISILDKNNKLISAPGGCTPVYGENGLEPMYQSIKIFTHPHDVCVDDDDNLYVAQWNSGKTYPIKLNRI
ncbi:6-bladed beta-propeller [Maribacter litoralis]|uniref:6-bladed beta-propeller n=1 Tax=Maribacter litoralis TaxID=2059726 RepID=UPI000E31B9D5|nr:6-bladed beta-propeller [Maribacter litoralis]